MSIINSYDESDEIVKPEVFANGLMQLPEIAIVCFKYEIYDILKNRENIVEYSDALVCGEHIKIFKTVYGNKEIAIYRSVIGSAGTVSMMEELKARGVKKFVFFGSCGELTNDLPKGAFIIPTEAYRDEGTSYHYLPASDFIKVETAKKLSETFEKNNIKFVNTKIWTTDAFYRETVGKMNKRVEDGCEVVDMECSAIMAMAKKRGIQAYQFLYTDDTLASEEWEIKTLGDDRTTMIEKCLDIALKVAEEI